MQAEGEKEKLADRLDELSARYVLTDRLYRARSNQEAFEAGLDASATVLAAGKVHVCSSTTQGDEFWLGVSCLRPIDTTWPDTRQEGRRTQRRAAFCA